MPAFAYSAFGRYFVHNSTFSIFFKHPSFLISSLQKQRKETSNWVLNSSAES